MSRPLENLAMPSNYRAKFDDTVARIPMIRHRILEHITPPQYREEVKDFLDDLESMCADGWALYKYARARESGKEAEIEKLKYEAKRVAEVLARHKDRIWYHQNRENHFEGDFDTLLKEIKRLEKENKELKRERDGASRTHHDDDDDDTATVTDIAALGELQRDLNKLLVQMRYLDAHADALGEPEAELRGGGGELEDEEHVYRDAEYKNWDHVWDHGHVKYDVEEQYMQQLKNGIERLEMEIARLEEQKRAEYEELRRKSMEHAPGMHVATDGEELPKMHERAEWSTVAEAGEDKQFENECPETTSSCPACHTHDASLRGGNGDEPIQSSEGSLADDFERIYEELLQTTYYACERSPLSACTQAWMSVAGILQTRNKHLQRELEDYKEINRSLIEDLEWNADKVEELEEVLNTEWEKKTAMLDEIGSLSSKLKQIEVDIAKISDSVGAIEASVERSHEAGTPVSKGKGKAVSIDELREQIRELDIPVSKEKEKASSPSGHPSRSKSSMKSATTSKATKTEDPSTWKTPIDYFIYFPKQSEILYPGSPQPLLHFTGANNLDDIRRTLDYRHEHGMATDPFEIRIREIMIKREEMGILLPDTPLDDSFVIIDIPMNARVDPEVKLAAWITNEEEDEQCLNIYELRNRDYFEPSKGNAELHVRKFGNEYTGLDHIVDLALNPHTPFDCSCASFNKDCEPGTTFLGRQVYRSPYVSVRGGGGDDDDDDDYDSDDDEDYTIPFDDTDSDDDEVEHEDEAKDPWDTHGPERTDNNLTEKKDLEDIVWRADDLIAFDDKDEELARLRGRGDADDDDDDSDDEDDYTIPCDDTDTDSDDDEVDHEHEAKDPWDTYGAENLEGLACTDDFAGIEWQLEDLTARTFTLEDEDISGLRGGACESHPYSSYVPSSSYQIPKSTSPTPRPLPRNGMSAERRKMSSTRGGASFIEFENHRRRDGITERKVISWLDPEPAPRPVAQGNTTPSAKSIHVLSRYPGGGGEVRSSYDPESDQATAGSSIHRNSLLNRMKELLAALVRYIKYLVKLARRKKPEAVPILRAGVLVPTPPQATSLSDSQRAFRDKRMAGVWEIPSAPAPTWDPQHRFGVRRKAGVWEVPSAPEPTRAASTFPTSIGTWSSTSIVLTPAPRMPQGTECIVGASKPPIASSTHLPPTPPRKNTPPIPPRNPLRNSLRVKKNPHTGEDLGNGEQDREDIAERSQVNNGEKKVVGACMAEGSAFDSDPWVPETVAGPSDPWRCWQLHRERWERMHDGMALVYE